MLVLQGGVGSAPHLCNRCIEIKVALPTKHCRQKANHNLFLGRVLCIKGSSY